MALQLHGNLSSAIEVPKTIWKTADEIVNDNTIQVDDVLQQALETSSTYHFIIEALWETDATADFKFDWNYTGTETAYFITEFSIPDGDTMTRETVDTSAPTTFTANASTGTHGYCRISGVIKTTSTGTLQFRWAQATTNAPTDTKVLAGSRMTITKVA